MVEELRVDGFNPGVSGVVGLFHVQVHINFFCLVAPPGKRTLFKKQTNSHLLSSFFEMSLCLMVADGIPNKKEGYSRSETGNREEGKPQTRSHHSEQLQSFDLRQRICSPDGVRLRPVAELLTVVPH